MKKYSEILKKTKNKKKENNILYGWYLLKRDKDNQLIIEKNKDDYSVEYIEYFNKQQSNLAFIEEEKINIKNEFFYTKKEKKSNNNDEAVFNNI